MAKLAMGLAVCMGLGWGAIVIAKNFRQHDAPSSMTYRVIRGDLVVTVDEPGVLESAENLEIKSQVRGFNAVLWLIDSGSFVNEGDELVRLNPQLIQEQVDERTKYSNWSQSAADRSAATVAHARLAVDEYQHGRYQSELLTMEKDIVIAKSALQNVKDRLSNSRKMANSGYVSELDVEEKQFAVQQAELNLKLKQTQLDVLKNFTYKEQLQTLKGDLAAIQANHKANVERAIADNSRRDRAINELQYCVIKAPRSGLVIHPNAAQWESGPIAEGTNVHKNQVLLLMPDLKQMQVKVGVHESAVKRVAKGQRATVTLPTQTMQGTVTDVASITKPAGWWTGNQVRYDTIVTLPEADALRPGTSAEVEIQVARHNDVLLVPVATIVDHGDESFCWIQTADGVQRKRISIGDTNDVFTIVEQGLAEGDQVVLNPYAYEAPVVDEANTRTVDHETNTKKPTDNKKFHQQVGKDKAGKISGKSDGKSGVKAGEKTRSVPSAKGASKP